MKKIYRFPEKLVDKIQKDFKEQGFNSENDYVIHALEHFLACKKTETFQALKLIPLKYAGKCLKCQKEQPVGSWAMWGRGVGIICMDCYVQKFGDKSTAKLVMRLKEIKWKIQAVQKELDEKAEQLRKFNFYEVINKMHEGYREIYKLTMEYLKAGFSKPEEEKEALDEIERLCKKQWAIIEEAERFMRVPFKKKRKKKQEA